MKPFILVIAVLFCCSIAIAGTVTDRDGNVYKTIKIGNLEWMAEDSKFEAAGSECVDENANPDNCVRVYGSGINDENMCPVGWRLPTVNDVEEIENMFYPNDYEQMTEKQKRHALPGIKKAFNDFLDSKNWPRNSFNRKPYYIYHAIHYSPYSGQPSLRSFYRTSDDDFIKADFFMIDGMTVAKVRCVKKEGVSSNKKVSSETSAVKVESNAVSPNKNNQEEKIIRDPRDGKKYQTVTFNGRIWMAENLNYASNGSLCYDNDSHNCDKYGRLYTWGQAMKACPNGWRLPSEDEWENAPLGIWNEFAGYFYVGKRTFYKKDAAAYYWTKSESDSDKAFDMDLNVGSETFVKKNHSKTDVAFSVRCIKK